jgi:hypothetical protein
LAQLAHMVQVLLLYHQQDLLGLLEQLVVLLLVSQ